MSRIVFTVLVLTVLSCKQESKVKVAANNNVKEDSKKSSIANKVWATDGSMQSDTVLVICAGGPKWQMDILKSGKTNYRYIPGYDTYGIVYVHQTQTIDESLFNKTEVLSLEESKKQVVKNSDMLEQAIIHFKDLGKTVIVIAKSYGAFIVQDYLANRKSSADKYYILAGRLKINKEMTEQHLRGFNGEFSTDGLTYVPEDEEADWSAYTDQENSRYKNKQMLKAGYGTTDYMKALEKIDLTAVTYIYGTTDQNVGRLTQEEVRFLKSKDVHVITAVDKDHSGVTYAFIDMLLDGTLRL